MCPSITDRGLETGLSGSKSGTNSIFLSWRDSVQLNFLSLFSSLYSPRRFHDGCTQIWPASHREGVLSRCSRHGLQGKESEAESLCPPLEPRINNRPYLFHLLRYGLASDIEWTCIVCTFLPYQYFQKCEKSTSDPFFPCGGGNGWRYFKHGLMCCTCLCSTATIQRAFFVVNASG